jgi:hypothetical protein
MKRFDPIAVIALVLALIALLLVLMRPTPEQAAPQTQSESVPGFDWVSHGLLALETHDGVCAIRLEFPTRLEARPGDRLEWDIYNRCENAVTLAAGPRERVEDNRSEADDPFVDIRGATIQPGGKGRVMAQVKPESALTGTDDEQERDRWRFRWEVNGEAQEDPEIEIEYRRGRR